MPLRRPPSAPAKLGAHSQFKENLRGQLHARVTKEVKLRAGPSWDERMEKSMKAFQTKARTSEAEMKKQLGDAIERGRSRPTSAPIRNADLTPNQAAMLESRKKQMRELENEYRDHLDAMKDRMDKREPLFRLSDVANAFAMQRERMIERKRQMTQDEHERWEHLKSLEQAAASRPCLIEDPHFKKRGQSASALETDAGAEAAGAGSSHVNPHISEREEYAKDIKIREAINSQWFRRSEWAQQVREIRERADNRLKLHEIEYPNKGDRHALTRNRLMHTLPAQVPAVY